MSRRSLMVVLSVAFVLSTCSFLQGQSTYGAVTGSVTDPSGAAITDAQVTLTNLGTAEKRTQATGPDGLYTFVNLIPGNYKVEVEKSGFKHTTGRPVGKNPFDFANYQIGGSFANESAEYLDGQPLNIGYINLPLLVPTQDSISEFKVQYNNLGPEWGKFSGGVINLSTKSGTN